MDVRLTWTEVLTAASVGVMRNVQSQRGYWKRVANQSARDSWSDDIEGAMGECAVAKYLGMYWEAKIGDPEADDVGPMQVRTNTSRKLDDTILRPRDKPDRIYVGVLSFCPKFILLGWIWGADGKNPIWLRNGAPNRPPCYFVPRSALQPLATLSEELMKRYSIMARENQQGARDLELCQCDSNPEALVEAARAKRMRLDNGHGLKIQVPKYAHVFAVDHGKGSSTNG